MLFEDLDGVHLGKLASPQALAYHPLTGARRAMAASQVCQLLSTVMPTVPPLGPAERAAWWQSLVVPSGLSEDQFLRAATVLQAESLLAQSTGACKWRAPKLVPAVILTGLAPPPYVSPRFFYP